MQVLYDEINAATKARIQDVATVSVGEIFRLWMEEACKVHARLVAEGLVESVKELDKMIEVQSKFVV